MARNCFQACALAYLLGINELKKEEIGVRARKKMGDSKIFFLPRFMSFSLKELLWLTKK
jgi:hypothetical protein